MLSLIGGIDVFLTEKMGQWVGSIWFWQSREPSEEEAVMWSRSPGLRFSDGKFLEEKSPSVERFYRSIEQWDQVRIAGRTETARIRGVTQRILDEDLEHAVVRDGRLFSTPEMENGRLVCVIAWELEERIRAASELGGEPIGDIVGMHLIYSGVRLEIVGALDPKDENFEPRHLRRAVLMPLETMRKYIAGYDPQPGNIRVQVADPEAAEELSGRIARDLKTRHRGVQDFEYRTAEWLDEITRMFGNISLLMFIVSSISLSVGGLSIMNVMLSSISERIHEIGVRKALGARNMQIFVQFVAESVTLSLVGGSFGVFLGMIPLLFKDAIQKSTDGAIVPTILLPHLLGVFGIVVGVGILFGLYPAVKASRMDPIEALRYE
jgi:putative ABC transport system permease protein